LSSYPQETSTLFLALILTVRIVVCFFGFFSFFVSQLSDLQDIFNLIWENLDGEYKSDAVLCFPELVDAFEIAPSFLLKNSLTFKSTR
jgi:hypothetical protein